MLEFDWFGAAHIYCLTLLLQQQNCAISRIL